MFAYANAVKQDIVLARQLSVNPRRIWPLDFEWCFPNELEKNGRVASMRSCYPAFECMCSYMAGICCKVRHILSLDHTATLSQLRGLHRAAESEAYTNNVICKLKDAVDLFDHIDAMLPHHCTDTYINNKANKQQRETNKQ